MKKSLKQPCAECPYRRKSLPGWLGADSPEGFMGTTMADHTMPCHMTVDYERKNWRATLPDAEQCAGAAIFFANICKLSRDPDRMRLPADRENVFATPMEFVEHHSNTSRRSEDDEE